LAQNCKRIINREQFIIDSAKGIIRIGAEVVEIKFML